MNQTNSLFIVGGSAGAKIATNIFKMTHPNHSLYYVECFSEDIHQNKIYSTLDESLDFIKNNNVDYFIATGDNMMRRSHYNKIKEYTNREPINCIHPSVVCECKRIGYGNLICPNAVLHIDSVIGNGTIINTGAIVEHDCIVGDFSQISPNTTLCGYVKIGENAFISASSTIIPKISIGENSIVAAGAVVINNIPPNVMVAGVPAKIKKEINI